MKSLVPEEFYKGDAIKPTAYNVGELIVLLEKLPKHLKVEADFETGVQLAVYNIRRDPVLMLEEIGK